MRNIAGSSHKSFFAFLTLISFLGLLLVAPFSHVRASYVLPYPSFMPGNRLYRVSRFLDKIQYFWYWGSLARIKYHLHLSDKYLVEAKTLFEYHQYLLAVDALTRSNDHFLSLLPWVGRARTEGKDVSGVRVLLAQAVEKHRHVLGKIAREVPSEVEWKPERQVPTRLFLKERLDEAVAARTLVSSRL